MAPRPAVLGMAIALALASLSTTLGLGVSGSEVGGGEIFTAAGRKSLMDAGEKGLFNTSLCGNWPMTLVQAQELSQPVLEGASKIAKFLEMELANSDIPGYTFSVVYKDKVLVSEGKGMANSTKWGGPNAPVTPDSPFFIGSTTKVFTSYLAYILHEKGLLSLETSVREMDPQVGGKYEGVTLQMLLSHLGGFLRNAPCNTPFTVCNISTEYVVERMNADYDATIKIAPQTTPMYSNYGFALAGRLMENYIGENYEDMIQKHILGPLGMRNSGFHVNSSNINKFGRGSSQQGGKAAPLPVNGWAAPAGWMFSTANDMAKFMSQVSTLNRDTQALISNDLTRNFLQPQFVFPSGNFAVGRPWEMVRAGGWFNTKNGIIGGYYTQILAIPNLGLGIFMSFNAPPKSILDLAFGAAYLVGKPLAEQLIAATQKADSPHLPSDLENFEGIYTSDVVNVKVSVVNGRLTATPSDGSGSTGMRLRGDDPTDSTWETWAEKIWDVPCLDTSFGGEDLEPVMFFPKQKGAYRKSLTLPGLLPGITFVRSE